MIVGCLMLLLFVTLTAVGWFFMRKDASAKEVISDTISHPDLDDGKENVKDVGE